jgi:N-acetylmuramic acid 6-phosphate etherase
MNKVTEQDSLYNSLEKMSTIDLVQSIHNEDKKVTVAVAAAIPQIVQLINAAFNCLLNDGRLIYMGAGTSGRLGVLDASELPPTFGVSPNKVISIIAGGSQAITTAVENAEDDGQAAVRALKARSVTKNDFVIGIAASGYTSFVNEGIRYCVLQQIQTGCITCNPGTPLASLTSYPIEVITGPEFVTGSTRMKAGTAQKMVLNIISTSLMIKLGHVHDNKMIDLQPLNEKLRDRAIRIIMEKGGIINRDEAERLLQKYGSVKKALGDS